MYHRSPVNLECAYSIRQRNSSFGFIILILTWKPEKRTQENRYKPVQVNSCEDRENIVTQYQNVPPIIESNENEVWDGGIPGTVAIAGHPNLHEDWIE